ncbi:ATP-binding protein [Propionivibrio sp.]|uniref:ATP-binding protein n=1 Tax=Propionivibrio sp. TaxID=2212460 RepID=UPI0025E40A2E|nr:ATP-binding protein [Propionivibrio sp.]
MLSVASFPMGNDLLLREMINNLLDNALRYTPDGGRVTARVVAQGDFVLLEIEDSGIGIADEDAHKVFDRFFTVLMAPAWRAAD